MPYVLVHSTIRKVWMGRSGMTDNMAACGIARRKAFAQKNCRMRESKYSQMVMVSSQLSFHFSNYAPPLEIMFLINIKSVIELLVVTVEIWCQFSQNVQTKKWTCLENSRRSNKMSEKVCPSTASVWDFHYNRPFIFTSHELFSTRYNVNVLMWILNVYWNDLLNNWMHNVGIYILVQNT